MPTICSLLAYRAITDGTGTGRLQAAWSIPLGTTSPVLAGGVLFAASSNLIVALDPTTGHGLWRSVQSSAGGTIGAIHW